MWISYVVIQSSVMSDSLQSHGLHHARPPWPPLSPGVCSNLCLLSQQCYLTISSSVAPFSSCPQSFPASGSFQWISCMYTYIPSLLSLPPTLPSNPSRSSRSFKVLHFMYRFMVHFELSFVKGVNCVSRLFFVHRCTTGLALFFLIYLF